MLCPWNIKKIKYGGSTNMVFSDKILIAFFLMSKILKQ